METTLTSRSDFSLMRTLRLTTLGLGVALALLVNPGDRARSASPANSGIDPLQILDTSVKNNILFIVDTSGSMAGTPQNQNDIVGGDDPASRFYQTKRAVREVIVANKGKANFGLATFHPDFREHQIDGNQSLVYVTQDPSAERWRTFFTGGTPAPWTDSCVGANCTATESIAIRAALNSNNGGTSAAYPAGCTPQVGDQVATNGVPNAPIPHDMGVPSATASLNAGSDCRYYIKSKTMLNNKRFQVAIGDPTATQIRTSANITCPLPPAGLLGDDVQGTADGTQKRACFQIQDVTRVRINYRASINSATDGLSYTAAPTWTPAADSLLIAVVSSSVTAPAVPALPANVTGHGVVYTLVNTTPAAATFPAIATNAVGVYVAKAGGSPTAAAVNATFASPNRTGADIIEFEVTGADVSGTAAQAIAQAVTATGTGTTATMALAPGTPTNASFYFVTHLANEGANAAAGWTEVREGSHNSPNTSVHVQFLSTFVPVHTATWGTSSAWRSIGLEIKAAPPNNRITTYWLTGTNFDYTNVTATTLPGGGTSTDQCDQSGINVDVAACDDSTVEDKIQALMRMELQYDANGLPKDVPALTNLAARKPQINELPNPFGLTPATGQPTAPAVVGPPVGPPFLNPGIRQGNGTPLAKSMQFALSYFTDPTNGIIRVSGTTGTVQRPYNAIGKQKQFVILLTDGDESCGGNPQTAAYNLWSNTAPALPNCSTSLDPATRDAECLNTKGVTYAAWQAKNRIELLLITFAGGSPTNVNNISKAGTGFNPATSTCDPGAPCRNGYIADDLTTLINQLNDAITKSVNTGEFSDQQSISESVYEYVNLAALPPGVAGPLDPLNPFNRYAATLPLLFQSTMELPEFRGHLRTFRNVAGVSTPVWDAGAKLTARVSDPSTGMNTPVGGACTSAPTQGCHFFPALYGNATPDTVKDSTAKIKRRVYTTIRNGVNSGYTASNLLTRFNLNPTGATDPTLIPIWPPTAAMVPQDDTTAGSLDAALGLTALTTADQVTAATNGAACKSSNPADLPAACNPANPALALTRARREAREMAFAFIAGAEVFRVSGIPLRDPTTDNLIYVARSWALSESTLSAPAIVAPPPPSLPRDHYKEEEYKLYRDGMRLPSGQPVQSVDNGLGVRNPDLVLTGTATIVNNAKDNAALKPIMSVAYHSSNMGLHAFRGGPCPTPLAGSGLFGAVFPCTGETGGEELWAFVPFDQLDKLTTLLFKHGRGDDKVYMMTAPVRFADIFVPTPSGTLSPTIGDPATPVAPAVSGVWRTILYVGRGSGGKYVTALDVTTPGNLTKHSLQTNAPIVAWTRGNPDTTDGKPLSGGNVVTHDTADYVAYAKMGETWSTPAIGFIGAVGNPPLAKPSFPTTRSVSTDFLLFMGSGYSDVPTEGKTFYVMDPLTGDVLKSFDMTTANGPAAPETGLTNFLVASPSVYTEGGDQLSPTGRNFFGNPIDSRAKAVYFGDVFGRLWRYDPNSPATAPTAFFTADVAAEGNQPISVSTAVLQADNKDVFVFAESGRDNRVAVKSATNPNAKPFTMWAFQDTGGVQSLVFQQKFPDFYRGMVQPAGAFASTGPVVFYGGVKFAKACVSQFDSILYAFKATTTGSGGVPTAAFDLRSGASDDTNITFENVVLNAIAVPGGQLQISTDKGTTPPPPAGSAATGIGTGGDGAIVVRTGFDPKSADYAVLSPVNGPMRPSGTTVCRLGY